MIRYLSMIVLSFTLIGCGQNGSKTNPNLASWSEVSKSCGNNPQVDEVVLACLNVDWIRTKDDFQALDVLLSDCINESFMSQPTLNYSFELYDMNNFEFIYSGSCNNQYQR